MICFRLKKDEETISKYFKYECNGKPQEGKQNQIPIDPGNTGFLGHPGSVIAVIMKADKDRGDNS
jgi:hypothetical protein